MDAPNQETSTGTVLARWSVLSMLVALGVVYLVLAMVGFRHEDALLIAGVSTLPLAVAVIVAVLVWKYYWRLA